MRHVNPTDRYRVRRDEPSPEPMFYAITAISIAASIAATVFFLQQLPDPVPAPAGSSTVILLSGDAAK